MRLGLPTLGDVAALPADAVLARFGVAGRRFHDLARGLDAGPPVLVTPPPDLVEQMELDPPVARVDAVAFAAKGLAGRLLFRLAERGLACTRVVIEAETEHGERLARCWRHDRVLTPAALAERVRWQLDGWLAASGERRRATICEVDPPPAGSRSCGSSPTRSCPPTAGSWGSGAATRPRTTAPTVRSRACRACSATKRSRPRSCRAGVLPPSRCGGCRGVTRASRCARWWSTRFPPRGPARCRRRSRRVCSTRPRPRLSDEHGPRSWCRGGVSSRRHRRAWSARCCRAVAAPCGAGPARGPPTCGGGTRSRAVGARAGRWSSTAVPTRVSRVRGHGRSRPRRRRSDLRLNGCMRIYVCVRRAALSLELLVPRRRQPSRGAGRGSGAARARRAGDHRSRRFLRRGPLRRSGPGGRTADGVRRRAHARGQGPAERHPRSAGGAPDRAGAGPGRVLRGWPRRSARRSSRARRARRAADLARLADAARAPVHLAGNVPARENDHWFVLTGCRKGSVPTALQRDGPAAAQQGVGGVGRRVRSRSGARGAVGSRRSPRPVSQRRAGADRTAGRRRKWSPPTTCTTPRPRAVRWRPRSRRCVRGRSLDEVDGWLPAGSVRALAQPARATATVRAVAGRGRAHGRDRERVRLRLEARGAAPARLSRARRSHRDVVVARARARRGGRRSIRARIGITSRRCARSTTSSP